jgi:hypothetical protein
MSYELSNDDKRVVVEQHIKNIEYSLFNNSLSILVEEAVSAPDQNVLATLNAEKTKLEAKKSALVAELNSLTE